MNVNVRNTHLHLSGKIIAVTRGKEQAKEFSQQLEQHGAKILLFPAVEIAGPQSWTDCDVALTKTADYSGIIFTSVNAVHYFFQRAEKLHVLDKMKTFKIYAVGEKTKNKIEMYGLLSEKLPETFSSEQLAKEIVKSSKVGERFLFAKGNLAKDDIKTNLFAHGIFVDVITVYCTQEPIFDERRKKILRTIEEKADMITFFSPSSITNFILRASSECVARMPVAVIGETTAEIARREGMKVVLVSPQSTAEVFADSILHYYSK